MGQLPVVEGELVQVVAKVVEGGLQFEEPVELPVDTLVKVTIEPVQDWRERQRAGLEGLRTLIRERPIDSGGLRFTREELHERG